MAGVADAFVALVRKIVGLPEASGDPPDIMRLGLYPARVDACSSDGKTCDVTPSDTRVSKGEKNVEVLVGIPGATAVVQPGAIVLLGWRRGDPAAPYCMPAWVIGATVDKLVLNATMVYLAAEMGANFVALANLVDGELAKISTTLGTGSTPVGGGTVTFATPYTRASTAATKVKAV